MIPHVPAPDEQQPAGGADLAVGFSRAYRWWLVGGVAVVVGLGFLLWGANRPDDPVTVEGAVGGAETVTTPADGLQFAEVARSIGESCLKLLVADTREERASGLRDREQELDRVDGMLFVHDAPQTGDQRGFFTMAGVTAPLDVGFYGAGGEPLGREAMEPCSGALTECTQYPVPDGWQFAIETKPGQLPEGPLGPECAPPEQPSG